MANGLLNDGLLFIFIGVKFKLTNTIVGRTSKITLNYIKNIRI